MPRNQIYESPDPATDTCCLCGDRQGPFTFENRPTGPGLWPQRWAYCEICAARRESIPDPEQQAVRYLVFLRWLMSGYRLRRCAFGPNGYRIVPGVTR
jgi:hypothetical protein